MTVMTVTLLINTAFKIPLPPQDFDITSNDAEDTLIEVTLTQIASVEDSGW